MSEKLKITCKVETIFINFSYKKAYLQCLTLDHTVSDTKVVIEKDRKISIVFEETELCPLSSLVEILTTKRSHSIEFETEKQFKLKIKEGYVINQYSSNSFKCE